MRSGSSRQTHEERRRKHASRAASALAETIARLTKQETLECRLETQVLGLLGLPNEDRVKISELRLFELRQLVTVINQRAFSLKKRRLYSNETRKISKELQEIFEHLTRRFPLHGWGSG